MPEFHLDTRKIKRDVPEIEVPSKGMGTLAAYVYVSGSIGYFDSMIQNLEYAVSRNPSISEVVTPTIDWMKITKEKMLQNRQSLLSVGRSDLQGYEKSVRDYEELISRPGVEEVEIQKFFEENFILIDRAIEKIIPKKSLGGEGFPDFIVVRNDGNHILIEIEKPSKKLYTSRGNPTAEFKQAEQQILDYLQWANEEKEFLRKRGLPSITVESTSGLLIIGMSKDLDSDTGKKFERKKFACKHADYEIKTFDEILRENQQVIDSIRKHSKQ